MGKQVLRCAQDDKFVEGEDVSDVTRDWVGRDDPEILWRSLQTITDCHPKMGRPTAAEESAVSDKKQVLRYAQDDKSGKGKQVLRYAQDDKSGKGKQVLRFAQDDKRWRASMGRRSHAIGDDKSLELISDVISLCPLCPLW